MSSKVIATIRLLRDFSTSFEGFDSSKSGWTVGKHLEHCSKTMIAICTALSTCQEKMPPRKWSIARSIVFFTGRIPRGKAQAPESVHPDSEVALDSLENVLNEAEAAIDNARQLPSDRWFEHPYIGPLARDEALELARIHNNHHLRIIRDIVRELPK